MTPAARIGEAIAILEALESTGRPADRFIRDWFRARRYAGSKDRAQVAEHVFGAYRRRAHFSWRLQSTAPRALMIASLLDGGTAPAEIEALFSGEGHAPAALTQAERAALEGSPPEPPDWVKGEFPEFLTDQLVRAFGDRVIEEMVAFLSRAPIDLRANTLTATRDVVIDALKRDSLGAQSMPFAREGVRLPPGARSATLSQSALFRSGAFEFQDEAAQIAVLLSAARPGMRVLDLAAGAGGKTLGLAALMANEGEIVACDIREEALAQLRMRAARAGVSIVRTVTRARDETFDLVFLDAPCSGSGTWRRQPELKWRLTPERLSELCRLQEMLLEEAAARVSVGGRLVYATCSVLPQENEDRVAALARKRFAPVAALAAWSTACGVPPPPGMGQFFRPTPLQTGTDGFFTALFERTS